MNVHAASDDEVVTHVCLLIGRLVCRFVCWFGWFSAGLHKNHQPEAKLEDESQPRTDPRNVWCGST